MNKVGWGKVRSDVSSWQRALQVVFAKPRFTVGTRIGSATRSRYHSFRKAYLLDDVSILLGHSSTDITKKHYAPWVKSWRDRLTERVRQADCAKRKIAANQN